MAAGQPTDDSRPKPSVFLSYASEDRQLVQTIRDALPGLGLDVWYDESELGGGEAWDQKIRRQIRECDFFMPVISARTEARAEGYFRREWRFAVERTLDMADDHVFLVPVVIDNTVGETARVLLHSRSRPGTALLAWEADRILKYQLVPIKEGDNPVAWPVDGPQFPNFTLTAARMAGEKFDQASLDIRVERDLRVTIVGHDIFAAALDAPTGGQVDYRLELASSGCVPHELPADMLGPVIGIAQDAVAYPRSSIAADRPFLSKGGRLVCFVVFTLYRCPRRRELLAF